MSEDHDLQDILSELDPEAKTAFAEAILGKDAEEFFHSDLGRYLIGCAQQEYSEAGAKLKKTPWFRVFRITELQNEMWRAENFMVWLRDLIIQGRAANNLLKEDE